VQYNMNEELAKRMIFVDFLQYLFNSSELIGTVAFAASGAMLAIDRDLDLFGVLTLGSVTAVGGGIVRDVLLGTFPPNAFNKSIYMTVALLTSFLVFIYAYVSGPRYWRQVKFIDQANNFLDAVGLGIFSVVGAQTAISKGFADNGFLCLFMGMMTGVGGGMIRDLLSMTVPAVLKKRIYAVASIAGAAGFLFTLRAGVASPIAMLSGMAVTIIIRMLSTKYAWDLPKVRRC